MNHMHPHELLDHIAMLRDVVGKLAERVDTDAAIPANRSVAILLLCAATNIAEACTIVEVLSARMSPPPADGALTSSRH